MLYLNGCRVASHAGEKSVLVAARRLVGEWLSLVEHLVRDQGVGGSNPLSPTIYSLLSSFLRLRFGCVFAHHDASVVR
jgi:hypothetical protein